MAYVLEFANLIINFGREKVMADLLDEVVIPAFTDGTLRRHFGKTTYFFQDVQLLNLGTKSQPEPAVAGRFIKDTVVRREQYLNPETGRIEPSPREMPTAPSVTFTLLLANHKLLYLRETGGAPGFDAFKSTLKKFLTHKYFSFVDAEYARRRADAADEEKSKITKKSIREEYLPPLVTIIPLASEATLVQSIKRFEIIDTVRVELGSVNAEAHNADLFVQLRAAKNAVEAERSILIETKKEGLNKEEVAKQLSSVALEGNAKVSLYGRTPDNSPLDVSNTDEMRLRVPVANPPLDLEGKAGRSLHEFRKAIQDGTIIVGKVDEETAARIRGKFRS
ncbi:MAG TPA: hypothetical protein VGR35_00200 [Tepidisphaeraceae bacterium]|nr:hypothetical protein [Tepidisphaeraceae bacterium]